MINILDVRLMTLLIFFAPILNRASKERLSLRYITTHPKIRHLLCSERESNSEPSPQERVIIKHT